MNDEKNVLATIPGEIIGLAARALPNPQTAPDKPHIVQIHHEQRWIRITFKRFEGKHSRARCKYKRGQPSSSWFGPLNMPR